MLHPCAGKRSLNLQKAVPAPNALQRQKALKRQPSARVNVTIALFTGVWSCSGVKGSFSGFSGVKDLNELEETDAVAVA